MKDFGQLSSPDPLTAGRTRRHDTRFARCAAVSIATAANLAALEVITRMANLPTEDTCIWPRIAGYAAREGQAYPTRPVRLMVGVAAGGNYAG
jgi:hypothetical protein